jgi:ubiquinone/menaquinone biosynthesis C-methylase UbiE
MNIAAAASAVSSKAAYVADVARTIREGGGISYDSYAAGDFLQRMIDRNARMYDERLIDGYLAAVPGLTDELARGIDVCDVGCGTGHVASLMGRAFLASTFVGVDFSAEAIAAARQEASNFGLSNVRFEVRDASALPADATYDLVTAFDCVHDLAHPGRALAEIHRVLRPGGTLLMVDPLTSSNLEDNIEDPIAPFIYATSLFHCMQVSLAQGGEGLGTAYGEQTARRLLADAGFVSVELARGPASDPVNGIFVCRTSSP